MTIFHLRIIYGMCDCNRSQRKKKKKKKTQLLKLKTKSYSKATALTGTENSDHEGGANTLDKGSTGKKRREYGRAPREMLFECAVG